MNDKFPRRSKCDKKVFDSMCLSLCFSHTPPLCLSLSPCLSFLLSLCISLCLSPFLSLCLCLWLCLSLSLCVSLCVSLFLPFPLSLFLFLSLSLSPFMPYLPRTQASPKSIGHCSVAISHILDGLIPLLGRAAGLNWDDQRKKREERSKWGCENKYSDRLLRVKED